jgi:hypothetical protein
MRCTMPWRVEIDGKSFCGMTRDRSTFLGYLAHRFLRKFGTDAETAAHDMERELSPDGREELGVLLQPACRIG